MSDLFPTLSRSSEAWYLTNQSVSGGVSLAGTQQVAANPAALWCAKVTLRLKVPAHYTEARGFLAGLDGRYGSFSAGPVDWRGQPWFVDPLTGVEMNPGRAARSYEADPHTQTNEATSGKLDFSLAAPVEQSRVLLSLLRTRGGLIRRGQYLQLGDRMHVVTGSDDAPDPGTGLAVPGRTVSVAVRPWTRAAYAAGTVVLFESPTTIMRLADPSQAVVEMGSASPQSDLSLSLVEAL